uniref:G-protein coupled receptors family 1 profile domain-containing protein n=1 Tax=Romanomermis culicivorax TaxID=13658 RepID=A0A915HJ53_ROMCU
MNQTFGHVIGHLAVNHLIFNISSIGRGVLVQFKSVRMANVHCFYWMTPALLTYTTGNSLILSMGIDRFLSFSYPQKKFPGAYAYVMVSAAWILGILNLVVAYFYTDYSLVPSCSIGMSEIRSCMTGPLFDSATPDPDHKRMALQQHGKSKFNLSASAWLKKDDFDLYSSISYGTALNGLAKSLWNRTNWVIFGLVTAVYPLTYVQVWRHSRLSSIHAASIDELRRQNVIRRNVRLLNTFILIVAVYVSSGLFTQLVVFLVNTLSQDEATIFYIESYSGILANFTSVCDFYVYYSRSDEYRKEFDKILVKFWPCCFSANSITSMNNTTGSHRSDPRRIDEK